MIIELLNLKINNLNSINNAFKAVKGETLPIVNAYTSNMVPSLMVLPGLGNFKAGMESLRSSSLDRYIYEKLNHGSYLLAVCLGMQLLGDKSEEAAGVDGLGLIKGSVVKLPHEQGERIPNVGWAGVQTRRDDPLFESLQRKKDFYFVHSYHFEPNCSDSILTETQYGTKFIVSAVKRDRILGVQFHPEKSATIGKEFLLDVVNWARDET